MMEFNIEVNSRTIAAEKGETILSALSKAGIAIPTLCNMKDLTPTGACRMCVVEVEGKPKSSAGLSFPVEEKMRIKTHSPRVSAHAKHSWNSCCQIIRTIVFIASEMEIVNCRAWRRIKCEREEDSRTKKIHTSLINPVQV